MSGAGKVVCVTGASGYVASWLVKLLLQRGYTVKATVTNLSDPNKVAHLKELEGADERLHLFKANLIEDGSFDSAVHGCEVVFHTASPAFVELTDPQIVKTLTANSWLGLRKTKIQNYAHECIRKFLEQCLDSFSVQMIEPAVKGTLNVLKSCSRESSVRRVVLTSSIVAVAFNRSPKGPDTVVDETWFSDPVFCEEIKAWYFVSKTLAEEAAWKFSKENDIDLVVTNPGFVIGPILQPTLNLSSESFLNLIKDVRDVAEAHILGFENPSASGRYLLVGSVLTRSEVLEILQKLYPSMDVPKVPAGDPTYQVCNKRAQDLGVVFTPFEVSLKDMVESLKEKKFLS